MKLSGPSAEELLTQGPETIKVKEIPQGVRVSPSTQQNLRPLQNVGGWLELACVENCEQSQVLPYCSFLLLSYHLPLHSVLDPLPSSPPTELFQRILILPWGYQKGTLEETPGENL